MKPYHHFRYLIAGGIDRTLSLASLLGSVALAFIYTAPAYAATQIFLTWPGIVGPSQVIGHVGDIPLTSYSQNASNMAECQFVARSPSLSKLIVPARSFSAWC